SRAQIERGRLDGARAARDAAAIRLEDSRLAVERAAGDTHRFADRLSGAVLQRAIAHAELEAARADLAAAESSLPGEPGAEVEDEAPAAEPVQTVSSANADAALAEAQAAVDRAWDEVNAAQNRADQASEAARTALAEAAMLRGLVAGAIGPGGGVARAVADGSLQGRRLVDCITVQHRT